MLCHHLSECSDGYSQYYGCFINIEHILGSDENILLYSGKCLSKATLIRLFKITFYRFIFHITRS